MPATASEGASRTSSVLGLNVAPSTATRAPERSGPAGPTLRPRRAAAQVAQIHLVQEPQRLAGAQLLCARLERADVLGQAGAAEAEPGLKEAVADARVVAQRAGQGCHVAAGRLTHLGHRVDEGDL